MAEALWYCTSCRTIAEGSGGMCPQCPDEPLLDVTNPTTREEVITMENDQASRAAWRLQLPLAAAGLVVLGVPVFLLMAGYDFHVAVQCSGFVVGGGLGFKLGSWLAKRRRGASGAAAGVEQAIAAFHRPGSDPDT